MGPRVGAGTYLLTMSLAVNVWCLAMIALHDYGLVPNRLSHEAVEYVAWISGGAVGYLFYYFSQRRFQDLNCPGSWARVLAVPLLGVIALPVLCFLSGPRYSNDFGDPPERSGGLKIAAAMFSFLFAIVLVRYVMVLYARHPIHYVY